MLMLHLSTYSLQYVTTLKFRHKFCPDNGIFSNQFKYLNIEINIL
ncbi:hypothetical protein FHS10_000168 [Mucilaginibacter dorajii]|nr:hypothetical protein [Mucilaginibacter dorajii]